MNRNRILNRKKYRKNFIVDKLKFDIFRFLMNLGSSGGLRSDGSRNGSDPAAGHGTRPRGDPIRTLRPDLRTFAHLGPTEFENYDGLFRG